MPFNTGTGVYTPATGGEGAVAGQIIASATWNSVHSDYSTALTQLGQAQIPCLNATFPARNNYIATLANVSTSTPGIVNFGASAGDVGVFTINLPTSIATFRFESIRVATPGAGPAFTGASTVSLYTAPGATGTAIITSTALNLNSSVNGVANSAIVTQGVSAQIAWSSSTNAVYLHITTSVTTASTAFVSARYEPYF